MLISSATVLPVQTTTVYMYFDLLIQLYNYLHMQKKIINNYKLLPTAINVPSRHTKQETISSRYSSKVL